MTIRTIFKRAIFVSLLGHLTVFSIFSFSFGNRIPNPNYAAVFFWGQLLRNSQVLQPPSAEPLVITPSRATAELNNKLILPKTSSTGAALLAYQVKPAVDLPFAAGKTTFKDESGTFLFLAKRKEPLLLLHPLLPYDFNLYFKDRQVAHVELMFNIKSKEKGEAITVKRKISSGNLEVDLLSARYIGHYLFIQQSGFPADKWQTVKIDLSAHD